VGRIANVCFHRCDERKGLNLLPVWHGVVSEAGLVCTTV
jgi:hypothetical protein